MKATLIIHQGWADLISNNGLINYYSDLYDELILFTIDNGRKKILEHIFKNKNKIKIEIPELTNDYNGIDTCLNCMTYGSPLFCTRDNNIKCKYINYNFYILYENIKTGSFNNYSEWSIFRSNKYLENISFSHCFYLYNNIDIFHRINSFKFYRDLELEKKNYNEVINNIGNKYIVIHEDADRNFMLNKELLYLKNLPLYNLDKKSNNMVDQLIILENCEEIHLIESSYAVLIYYLCFISEKINNKKIYLYKHPNEYGRDIFIYQNPTNPNWIFI